MIAYRVEIWCNAPGCNAGVHDGIVHDDYNCLPGLGKNLAAARERDGWKRTADGKDFCPKHARKVAELGVALP